MTEPRNDWAHEVFLASPDGVIVQHDGIVRRANPSAARKLGYGAADELVGRSIYDLVHPDDRSTAMSRQTEILEGGAHPAPRLMRFLRRDGAVIDVETRGAPVQLDGVSCSLVVIRDAAERRRAELALRLSEERFRALLDGMADGVVLQDDSLVIKVWNPAAERILGLSGDQIAGVTSYDPRWRATDLDGRTLEGSEHVGAIALRTNRPVTGTMGVERGEGGRVWLHVSAVPLRMPDDPDHPYAVVTSFTDVTAARVATRQLEQSEARYRLLAENGTDLVSLRTLDNRFTYVSLSHQTVLGWSPEELLGRDATELRHEEDAVIGEAAMATLRAGGEPPPFTIRVRHKAGHHVWCEIVVRVVRDASGAPTALQVAGRDVSARRQIEEQLRQSRKLEALGRMAGGVAHDLNNAMTVVRAAASLLEAPEATDTARRQLLADIEVAAARAGALSAQLLTFSTQRHETPREVRVTEVLRETVTMFTRIAQDVVATELAIDAEADATTVETDPLQLQKVFFNLLANARDAMGEGGTVRVRCAVQALTMPLPHRHGVLASGSYVTVGVDDHGVGMTDEVQEHLFEPFYTTKPQGQGTGLGLATAFGIVQKAQGAITFVSTPGGGSSFVVHLPLIPSQGRSAAAPVTTAAQTPPAAEVEGAGAPPRGLVIVVDDEPAVCRVASAILRRAGYEVLAAANGAEGLAVVRREQGRIQALVTDVRMPGMTGVQMVQHLLDEHIDVPVLFVSGQLDAPLPANWPPTAPRLFLGKPFSAGALTQALHELLGAATRARST